MSIRCRTLYAQGRAPVPLHTRLDDGEGHSDMLGYDVQISKHQDVKSKFLDANSKFLDAKKVKRSKLQNADPQILDHNVQISVDRATWHPEFVHPCCKEQGCNKSFSIGNLTSVFQPVAGYCVTWHRVKLRVRQKRPWLNDGYQNSLGVSENNRE